MESVNDPIKLQRVQSIVASEMPQFDVHVQYKVIRVYEESSNYEGHEWYYVDILSNYGAAFYGMLDAGMSRLYLSSRSTITIVQSMIQSELDSFNAGHHWRYKGM